MLQSVSYAQFADPAGLPMHSTGPHMGMDQISNLAPLFHPMKEVAEKGGQRGVGHSPDEVSDRFSLKYCSSPEGARLPQRSSSRESNSNASGSGMCADERPGGPSGSVPRRQRCTKRRLSFTEDGDAHMAEEAAFEPPIERHTSGIYDLIDAIGLLDAQSAPVELPADSDGSGRGSSESHQHSETLPPRATAASHAPASRLARHASAPPEFEVSRARPGGVRKVRAAGPAAGRDSSRMGSWSQAQKVELVRLVREHSPCGAADWEAIADRLGRWSRGGASAERMYRTLTDPGYQKATNKHGRRLNKRSGTPMHVMAAHALRTLPGKEGNLTEISDVIKQHPAFAKDLDWSARPGTKTYPRWKDALIGCFKAGRYPHLVKTERKRDGLTVYLLDEARMPASVAAATAKALSAAEEDSEGGSGGRGSGSDRSSD
ncbi:g3248 [Coccomyxa elongata]